MNLNLTWKAPSPTPTCGFKIQYRRKADAVYTEIDISGSTVTTESVSILSPASYEGLIVNNCCSTVSESAPFGVNAYSPLTVSIVPRINDYLVDLSSIYPSSYATVISGTFNDSNHGAMSFTVTYPANVTSASVNAGITGYAGTISALVITTMSPVFDNGGQLQQTDPISTPPYFKLYWSGDASGTTWNGSPVSLPSFTIDAFNATEVDLSGNIISGELLISYILGYVFSASILSLNFEIFDQSSNLLGTFISPTSPIGLRNEVINITKVSAFLTRNTLYTFKVYTPSLTLIDTKTFYFP